MLSSQLVDQVFRPGGFAGCALTRTARVAPISACLAAGRTDITTLPTFALTDHVCQGGVSRKLAHQFTVHIPLESAERKAWTDNAARWILI